MRSGGEVAVVEASRTVAAVAAASAAARVEVEVGVGHRGSSTVMDPPRRRGLDRLDPARRASG